MRYGILLILACVAWAKDSCIECHAELEGALGQPAAVFSRDVHQHRKFGCADCHGGDPTADDPEQAMSPARGFRGKIPPTAVPEFCARCHSDVSLMHQYKTRQRVDQLAQYKTSVHGKRLAAGDTNVANCVDCHGVHEIREVSDPLSPVYPLRIPLTCGRCHADATLMAKYKLWPNQLADYEQSVHWKALAERGDLSAPSCASCHGNHGATPPRVSSVAAVCGTCHVLQQNLFDESPHKTVFAELSLSGCVVCHGNHRVESPNDGMLAGEDSVCAKCHEADSPAGEEAGKMAALLTELKARLTEADAILTQAEHSGVEVSEAQLQLLDGREQLVKARVAVHSFQSESVRAAVDEGLAIAAQTDEAGVAALNELNRRRRGLLFSLAAILVTLIGLWLAIRSRRRQGGEVHPAE